MPFRPTRDLLLGPAIACRSRGNHEPISPEEADERLPRRGHGDHAVREPCDQLGRGAPGQPSANAAITRNYLIP